MNSLPFIPLSPLDCKFQNKTRTEPLAQQKTLPLYNFHLLQSTLRSPLSGHRRFSGGAVSPLGYGAVHSDPTNAGSQDSLAREEVGGVLEDPDY